MKIMEDTFDDLGFLLPTILIDGTPQSPFKLMVSLVSFSDS
jgi:hypothetical protein